MIYLEDATWLNYAAKLVRAGNFAAETLSQLDNESLFFAGGEKILSTVFGDARVSTADPSDTRIDISDAFVESDLRVTVKRKVVSFDLTSPVYTVDVDGRDPALTRTFIVSMFPDGSVLVDEGRVLTIQGDDQTRGIVSATYSYDLQQGAVGLRGRMELQWQNESGNTDYLYLVPPHGMEAVLNGEHAQVLWIPDNMPSISLGEPDQSIFAFGRSLSGM